MSNLIMGTAGHIDHGKTTLIKALTNFDCDTHPEEKLRGITINLGFTHFNLSDGKSIGIVDVPGHADFIDTMVAGASGIDIVLMVIAADSGVMPQTIEHLRIMQTLGIKKGLIALTKIDRVEEEVIQLAETEIIDLLKGTFLENSPIVRVSAVTGNGLEELRKRIEETAQNNYEKEETDLFRMYIDRIFIKKGFGTVVTGSSLSGIVRKDDIVFVLPGEKKIRVRKIERHGAEVEQAGAGNRIAINLTGLNREEYKRGMVVSNRIISPTKIADANLKIYSDVNSLELWSQITFIAGTYKCQARIHLLDENRLKADESAVVQIHFPEQCILMRGDKYIIRDTSENVTLGGGIILDAYPLHHRRRPEKLLRYLKELSRGDLSSFIEAEVKKSRPPLSLGQLTSSSGMPAHKILTILNDQSPSGICLLKTDTDTFIMMESEKDKIQKYLLKSISNYHKRNSLSELGRTSDELLGIVKNEWNNLDKDLLEVVLNDMVDQKLLKKTENTWAIIDHQVELSDKDEADIEYIERFIEDSGKHTPLLIELNDAAKKKNITESMLNQILFLLVSQEKIYNIEGSFLHKKIVDSSRENLLKYLMENKKGISVAEFRDLINANRKICLLLFARFEKEGLILRSGDVRVLTEAGEKLAGSV